jgi:hypothetical protein
MASAITHARSSQRRWGGEVEDYLAIHQWFDETKAFIGDFRHRALRHHALGIMECIEKFGEETTVTINQRIECPGPATCPLCMSGIAPRQHDIRNNKQYHLRRTKKVPTRWIAEQHLIEDFGRIPSLQDWLECIAPQPWMTRSRKLSQEVGHG